MAILDAALVCAGLSEPPAAPTTLKAFVLFQLDLVGPVIVMACVVFIAMEVGVWIGVIERRLPGQPPDWDDDD